MAISLSGSLNLSGSLTTTGTITATTLVVQTITSSISSITGSTNFGSLAANTHTFTGSILITGSNYISVGTPSPIYTTTLMSAYGSGSDVDIDVKNNTSAGAANIYLRSQTDGSGEIRFSRNSDNSIQGRIQFSQANGSMNFRTGGNDNKLFISSSGNIGIGNATALHKLQIGANADQKTAIGQSILFLSANAGNVGYVNEIGFGDVSSIYPQSAIGNIITNATAASYGDLYFATRTATTDTIPTERMRIASNGLVSINNILTSSTYKLGVSGSAYINGSNGKGIFISDQATYASIVGLNSAISTYNGLELRASGTDYQLYLNTSGNVLVNTASSLNSARLEVLQTTNSSNTITIHNNQASPYGLMIRYSSYSPNNNDNWFVTCEDSTTTRIKLRSDGGINNYQGNNTNYSDIRLKKDIIPLDSYWDKFKAIEIVKFKYKDQTHDDYNIGVIAQQVESTAPEFVSLGEIDKDTPEDGIPIKSIYTEDLHHATIKVLQEAMTKIETLEAKVQYLENK